MALFKLKAHGAQQCATVCSGTESQLRAQSFSSCTIKQCPSGHLDRSDSLGACLRGHFERSGGTRAGPSVHFERPRGIGGKPERHFNRFEGAGAGSNFERSCVGASPSSHFKRSGGDGAGLSSLSSALTALDRAELPFRAPNGSCAVIQGFSNLGMIECPEMPQEHSRARTVF